MQKTIPYMPEDHMDELYNSDNFLVRYVHNNRLDNIAKQISSKENLKVLDAGCGEGHLLERLNKKNNTHRYYGIDMTEVALEKAKKRNPGAHFIKADLSSIDIEDNFFDVVICTETLEHIDEYQKVINELVRILKKDGTLIVTFPNEFWWTVSRFLLGRRPIRVVDHINFFSPWTMKKLVKAKLVYKMGLPLKMPFIFSLGSLMKFRKKQD